MNKPRACITALGCYVPERVVTNKDLEKIVDTSDEWIRTRTGIERRHYAPPGTPASDLALRAAQQALERRGIAPTELDLIIVGTVTPDMLFPATACVLQDKLKATRAWGFDISAACSGFVYALTMGVQFIESGAHKKVLVVGADVMTAILDFTERTSCVLFGDGAGAVLLEPGDDDTGILGFCNEVDGAGGCHLYMHGGGSLHPATHETVDAKMHYIHQDGPHVFKYAVRKMAESPKALLERYRLHDRPARPVRAAPGQRAHHRRRRGAAGTAAAKGGQEHRPLRQHHGGDDPAGARHRPRRGAAEAGPPGCSASSARTTASVRM